MQGSFSESLFPPSLFNTFSRAQDVDRPSGDEDLLEIRDEDGEPFRITVAGDSGSRDQAQALMEQRYAWRGYATSPLELHPSGSVTLTAHARGKILGTVTAAADGPQGMFIEKLYPEVDALRSDGRRLCEFTRLAIDEGVNSRAVLGALFHTGVLYLADLHDCTDVLIEVNPRHARFYQRMLGFEQWGELRQDPQVNAPAVLLRLDLRYCVAESVRLGGRRSSARGTRSIYPYFFAPAEAWQVSCRLQAR